MSRHPRRDTGPELAVRRILHSDGYRYRVNYPVVDLRRRTIDIAFPRAKVAIFIDGCFWHGCSEHRTIPSANRNWWEAKIAATRLRDAETADHLERSGWTCLRFWEHEDPHAVVSAVEIRLARRCSA